MTKKKKHANDQKKRNHDLDNAVAQEKKQGIRSYFFLS